MRLSLRGAAACLAVVALTSCGTAETPAAETTASPTTTPTPAPTPTPSAEPTSAVPPKTPASTADVTVDVSIAGGKVSTKQAVVKAKPGQTVRINVVSDVPDSVHVHGYDKTLDLQPGTPGSVEFETATKGIFEVETHESGKLLFKLQVS